MEECNGKIEIDGKKCQLAYEPLNEHTVFVTGLPLNIDDDTFFDTFSAFGPILDCKIQTKDHDTI